MFAGFGEQYGLDREMAIKLGRAFGSGMGQGGVCGALVGGYMILGLALQG
ncbi:MAG: C_GCAxxG_C_C family protein, partial [Deltaproteobacteria bacterium]|nr:C_GCAxxG_C_C family protein [Deltaproteobacteria bacterium]